MHDLVNRIHLVEKCFTVCNPSRSYRAKWDSREVLPPSLSLSHSSLCQFSHAVQRSGAARPFGRLALRRRFTTHCSNLGAGAGGGMEGKAPTAARKAMLIDERSILSLALLLMASSLALEGAWMVARLPGASCEYRLDSRG